MRPWRSFGDRLQRCLLIAARSSQGRFLCGSPPQALGTTIVAPVEWKFHYPPYGLHRTHISRAFSRPISPSIAVRWIRSLQNGPRPQCCLKLFVRDCAVNMKQLCQFVQRGIDPRTLNPAPFVDNSVPPPNACFRCPVGIAAIASATSRNSADAPSRISSVSELDTISGLALAYV